MSSKAADPNAKAADPKQDKAAAPDPADAERFVVLHHFDHHAPGRVLTPADVPSDPDERSQFLADYPTGAVVQRQQIPRLLEKRAIRPAGEDEAKAEQVPVSPWEGQAPRVNAALVISRAEVEGMRDRIRTLEAQKGSPEELQRLRDRVSELEGRATADKGAGVARAKGHPEG